ncbi:Zonadhesin [Acromyrmex echinatior]|uniref:Zonadhesin n=1 Tax=Acromyrmex echinatior TaxID=103372 RepID=F4X8R1_ACREC|nr:Zonadhesin [Acromyrmex echinatior]
MVKILEQVQMPTDMWRQRMQIKTTTRSKLYEKKECFVGSIKDINVSEATTSSEHLLYGPIIHMSLFYEDATNIQEAAIHLVYSLDPRKRIIDPMGDIKKSFENIDFPTNLSGNENLNGVYAIIGPFLIQKYLTYKTIAFFLELITLSCCIKRQLSPSQGNFQDEIVLKILISVSCLVSQSHASRKIATKRSKSTCIIYRWGCLYGKLSLEGVKTSIQVLWCVYADEFLTQKVLKIKENMKKSSKAIMIGIVIWLVANEIVLIYIACTIQTNKDITFEDQNVQRNNTTVPTTTSSMTVSTTISTTLRSTISKNFTEKTTISQTDRIPVFTGNTSVTTESNVATTKITIPTPTPNLTSKTSTTDGIITVPSTQSTTISMRSTTMPMQSTTQCVSNITYPSSTTASPYSTTIDATEIITTENITLPIISTTFVTNLTVLTPPPQLPNTTSTFLSSMPPVTTKTTNTTTITSKTNVTEKTTFTMKTITSTSFSSSSMGSSLSITKETTTRNSTFTDSDINVTDPSTTEENISKMTTPIFNYILRDDKGVACVLANMTIHVNLRYTTKDFQILESMLTVPTDATTTGICVGKTANMTLSWEEPVKSYNNKKNKITFNYSHDNSKFFLDSIFVDLHVQLKDELKGFNRGRKNSFAKLGGALYVKEYTYMKNSRKDKSHSEVLEKDDLLYVKSAASCASSRDIQCFRRGWNFKIFRASATQRAAVCAYPIYSWYNMTNATMHTWKRQHCFLGDAFGLPASMYRWLLNTRSIVQLLSLVLPLPTRLPFVNKPIKFHVLCDAILLIKELRKAQEKEALLR